MATTVEAEARPGVRIEDVEYQHQGDRALLARLYRPADRSSRRRNFPTYSRPESQPPNQRQSSSSLKSPSRCGRSPASARALYTHLAIA